MSEQRTDLFLWNEKEYVFLEATDIDTLFDPEKFSLIPEAPDTGCWKGFVIQFSVREDQLFFDTLWINCKFGIYPRINNVKARRDLHDRSFHVYRGLNIRLNYTGDIVIAKELEEEFFDRAFLGPHCYKEVYELHFENGKLTAFKETTGTYEGF